MTSLTVREYARLTTKDLAENTLDKASISESAFHWLCELQGKWKKKEQSFIDIDGSKSVRIANYVGFLQSPCGTSIEILPKTHENDEEKIRKVLWRMLCIYLGKDLREADKALLKCTKKPLLEWLIHIFLQELSLLVKKGLHAQYNKIEEERSFIRGQINIARQMRQPPHRQHLTHVRHHILSMNRAENRLLRSALHRCRLITKDSENWSLATQLEALMQSVPQSTHIANDFALWKNTRHLAQYMAIKPWCSLILLQEMPTALQHSSEGISLLFPMEKVFETFVIHSIRKKLEKGTNLRTQAFYQNLCIHKGKEKFALKPDILLEQKETKWIIDAKWKCLDSKKQGFDPVQSDMYQLFAYGHKFLNGKGDLALVYPETDSFRGLEGAYLYNTEMRLHVLTCNLETGNLSPKNQADCFPFWGKEL